MSQIVATGVVCAQLCYILVSNIYYIYIYTVYIIYEPDCGNSCRVCPAPAAATDGVFVIDHTNLLQKLK